MRLDEFGSMKLEPEVNAIKHCRLGLGSLRGFGVSSASLLQDCKVLS